MEYPKRSIHGDAGEYLVAYKITSMFGWPCRLIGVDLGVDAELELMGSDGKSTGDIIKIQVKTVDQIKGSESTAIYVDERHIDYWKRFCLPVIVCCVDLSTENIYWKQITSTEAYSSGGVSKKVQFCLAHDRLEPSSKQKLKELACPPESKTLDVLFSKLTALANELPNQTVALCDFESIADVENKCDEIDVVIKQIDDLVSHFPWRLSSLGMRQLNVIKRNVQITRNDCGYYHATLVEGG